MILGKVHNHLSEFLHRTKLYAVTSKSLNISGCIPPKTGSTSWGHFWWGMSKFDGTFDSWQSLGNRFQDGSRFVRQLKMRKPEMFILSVRHPIERLISGWNNILCNDNCRDKSRYTFLT